MKQKLKSILAWALVAAMLLGDNSIAIATEVTTESAYTEEAVAAPEPAPETAAPETAAPETQPPETQPPETQPPETAAPETAAPETQAPETPAPETVAPETQAPETSAPQIDEPETTAPETPVTEVPATETVRLNTVTFAAAEGAKILWNGQDVTNGTATAQDGKIVFTVLPTEGYEIVRVLVDRTNDARTTGNANEYIIEGISTDATIVTVETQAVETETETETETEETLDSLVFDVGVSSVVISDDAEGYAVTYNGKSYKKVSANGEIVLTGSTGSNTVSIDTGKNIVVRFRNVSFSTNETALYIGGNGRTDLVLEGTNRVKVSNGYAIAFADGRDVYVSEDRTRTGSLTVTAGNGPAIGAQHFTLDAPVLADGSDGYQDIDTASNLYRAYLNGMGHMAAYSADVTVDGNGYKSGTFKSVDDQLSFYVPNGHVEATVDGVVFEGDVNGSSTQLTVKEEEVETETEEITEEVPEEISEETSEAEEGTDKKTVYTYEDDQVRVTATIEDPNAIPDDAELVVVPIVSGPEYDAYIAAINEVSEESNVSPAFGKVDTLLYDISFRQNVIGEDGEVVEGQYVTLEPTEGSVSVVIEFKDNQLSENMDVQSEEEIEVYHLPKAEDGTISVENLDVAASVDEGDESVAFNSDFFSAFAVRRAPAGAITVNFTLTDAEGNQLTDKSLEDGKYVVGLGGGDNQYYDDYMINKVVTVSGGQGSVTFDSIHPRNNAGETYSPLRSGNYHVYFYRIKDSYEGTGISEAGDVNNADQLSNGQKITNAASNPDEYTYTVKMPTSNVVTPGQTFDVTLKAPSSNPATNDYNYQSILGPAINYGIVANTVSGKGHNQSNFAANNYVGNSGPWEPNLSGKSTGRIVVGNIDTELQIGQLIPNGPVIITGENLTQQTDVTKWADESGTIRISDDSRKSTIVHMDANDIASNIVNPMISHMQAVSGDMASKPATLDPEMKNGKMTLDTTGEEYPDDATIYVDADSYASYLSGDNTFVINRKPNQTIVFNFKSSSSVTIGKVRVYVNGEDKGDLATPADTKDPKNLVVDEMGRHIVWNLASCSDITLDKSCGMYLVPRSYSTIKTESTSSGWIVSAGTASVGGAEFHNVYADMPDVSEIQVEYSKSVDGVLAKTYQKFNFELEEYVPGTGWSKLGETVQNEGGMITFKLNKFATGYNAYRVKETSVATTTTGNYIIDTKYIYTRVKYEMIGNFGLAGTPEYYSAFDENQFSYAGGAGFSRKIEQPNKPQFENETQKVGLSIKKTVTGKVDTSKIFKFEVTAQQPEIDETTGKPTGKMVAVTGVKNATIGSNKVQVEFDVDGKAIVTLHAGETINIRGLEQGTTYTVKEVDIPQGYSKTSETNTSGTIDETDQTAVFGNTYHAENTTTFSGVKTMEGRSFKDGDSIKFTLEATNPTDAPMPKDSEGNVRAEVTINPMSGTSANFSFDEIKYTNEDLKGATSKVFKYKVTETCTNDGVEVVTKTNTIEVTVTDDGAGKLTIDKKYSNGTQLNFANKFTAAKAKLEATKVMEDWGKATSFTFTLAKANGTPADTPMPSTATATATKDATKATWAELSFDHEGTYTYTITEQDDGIAGVTYDTTPHTVTVVVTKDEATNKLSAEVKYDESKSSLDITNSFKKVTTHFEAKKSFNDWSKADSFTIVLTPVGTAPMPVVDGKALKTETKEVTADDVTAVFSDIIYDTTGTYEYILKETKDRKDGVYYDNSEHRVKVVVSKKGGNGPDKNDMQVAVTYDGGEDLTITNTYTDVTAPIEATKNFNAWDRFVKENPDFHFTFTLTAKNSDVLDENGNATMSPMPEGWTSNTKSLDVTQNSLKAEFGTIHFEKAGTYNYTIKETNDGVEGISYDDTKHQVKVVVTADPTTNKLTAKVEYDGRDALTIKNTFDSSSATLQATKSITNWGKAKDFTFKLAAVDGAPLPDKTEGKATKANMTVVFGEVEYKTAGTYKYTITEVNDHVDGVTYDETPHSVVVTVAPDANGKLKATVKYDGADDLFIENEFNDTTAEIKASKSINDWGKATNFTFTLTAKDGAPMPEGVTGTTKTGVATQTVPEVNFGEIHYDTAGVYEYTIKETNDHVDGVTYDETEHTVTVTVNKNSKTNALSTSVKYDTTEDALTITNTYTSIKKPIEVTKNFPSWDKFPDAKFTFDLAAVGTAPLPTTTSVTATKDDPLQSFGEIEFTESGVYKYTITEQNGKLPGVTYDLTPHNVTVTVTADPDTNALSAVVEYDDSEEGLTVQNTFADTTAQLKATKSFENWDKLPDEKCSFTFDLERVTANAPMPEDGITAASATQTSPDAVWASIHYDAPGTYEYTITERNDAVDGVSYDTTAHKVVVVVSQDPTTNKLSAVVKYDDKPSLTVTNTWADTSAQFEVTKSFDDWGKASSFTFDLKVDPQHQAVTPDGDPLDTPMPEKTTATATKTSTKALFNSITYEHAGTYYYIINEEDSHVDGVTYDTADKHVVVTVTKANDATNKLTASVKYEGKDALTITNTFKSSSANIQANKSFLDENNKSAWGKATSFEFNLTAGKSTTTDADGKEVEGTSPMPAGSKDGKKSVTVTEKSATAMFGEIKYDKAGTYRYTIAETKGDADGVTYDTQSHPVTVTVTKDDKNQLTATVTYGNNQDTSLTITNTYKATQAKIYAEKDFADWGKADSFEFTLAGKSGAPMPANNKATATKDNKKVNFGDITFEQTGDYEYTVTETKGDADGVTYDTTPHNVTVHVTKNDDNELSATVEYEDGTVAKITNTYATTDAEIKVTKAFADWGKAKEFTFDLAAVTEGAPMPATKQVKATDGNTVSFGKITYEQTGTYEYTITEQNGGVAGVSYDTAPKKVTVEVTKDADNKMTATVTYSNTEANAEADSQIVTNTFEAAKAEVEVTKSFNAWGKADSFTFNLTAAKADSPLPEKTQVVATKGHELQSFGEITFDTDGTYVYYITEVNDGKDGVSYDTTPHKVLIQVTKANDATNKLTATVTYDDKDEELTVTNTYTSVKTHMEVTKDFSDWGHAKQFDFVLAPDPDKKSVDANGKTIDTPMPATQDYEAHALASKKTAKFDEITYEQAGTYYYTITEVKGSADGVTYDTTPKHVVVTVTKADDATNELTADITYEGKSSLTVTNKYASSDATLQVTKQIADWGTADHFDFVLTAGQSSLKDEQGNVLDSPMPAGAEDGKLTATATKNDTTAVFGKIVYEQTGTYKYTINEVNGKADGVKYDTSTHDVLVTVTKDADNKMTATVKYDGEDDSLTIENEYKTVKTHFEVDKNFNDWNNSATTFTFDLAAVKATAADGTQITPVPMPAQANASATTASGKKAVFGDIEYKQAGTYEYTITEKDGKGDGVKYDLTPHKVIVTVTKANDATNALTAVVKYDDNLDKLEVTNKYTSTKAEIKVEKDFADWGKAKGFTFNLAAVTEGAPMPATTSVTATEDAKVQSFGEIEFKQTGEYKYTITEENGGEDGVSYDTTPKNVTVTVTKDADNQMTATVTYQKGTDAQIVSNTYESAKAELEVTKDFADWGKADSFTFVLAPVTKGAPMPKDKDGKNVTEATATQKATLASFGEITFENAGVFEYTITEKNDGKDGVSYDTKAHKVVVTVTKADDATNKLTASVKYDDEGTLTVKNTYEATTAELKATKSFTEWGKADTFKFDLEAVSAVAADGKTAIATVPMPTGAKDGKLTKDATEANPTAVFGTIKYEQAGTYKYTITEQNSHVDGVTYDTKAHEVVVTVTKADDATNKLTATVKYDGKDALTITNTFESSKATLAVTKSFKDWGKADSFTFKLAAVDGAPLTDEDGNTIETTVVATKGNETQVFGTIAYDKAGVYEYTITEVNDGKDGVSYDTTPHTVTVTVTKNETTNVLKATVAYDATESSEGTTDLTVTNTYEAAKASIEATKLFADWGKADSFTFDLEAVDGAPMPAGAKDGKISGTATKGKTTVNFGEITYEAAGTYRYTVTEQKGNADGVTYDTDPKTVTVNVTKADDETNKLTATVDYGSTGKLEITNTYATTDAEIKVTKEFADWGKANEFTFDLAAVTKGAPMPETTTVTATKGAATQSFGKITYEATGTYQYTITERNGGRDGVSYDVTPKTVTVEVTKDADNKMTATVTYTKGTDAEIITNTYESTTAQMEVTKNFNDWGKAEAFRFELKAAGTAPMPKADKDGKVIVTATEDEPTAVFDKITYEEAGTYEYTITEINDGADGVSYDVTPKKVTVTVTKADDATNKLTAKVDYAGATKLTVTNTYASTTAEIKATKSFNDWGKAKSFRFNLKPVDGAPMPADAVKGVKEATATQATPEATFGSIEYEEAGVYKYTITEVNDGADGVTYDSVEHEVVVTVTKADDATNKLTATVEYDGAKSLTITNTYAGSTAQFQATKTFTDSKTGADVWSKFPNAKFEFTLAPVGNAPMKGEDGENIATKQYATKDSAVAVFDTIKFEQSGTYEYTITETKGDLDGVTYDTTAHKVKVVVTKDPTTNKLTTAVTYDDAKALTVGNTFTSTDATLQATKDFADWGKATSFTFNLAAVKATAADGTAIDPVPMPAAATGNATEENPTVVFGQVVYEKAGTYEYTITEEKGDADGVTYDTTAHKVVVTVTKNPETNALRTDVKYDDAKSLVITNTYATTDTEIKVTKDFADWGKADEFEFTLAKVTENAPMPETTVVKATKDAKTASFGKIVYEQTGTYTYTITETNGKVDGVSYDVTPKTVTVKVTKDADNKMDAKVTYTKGTNAETITNTYTAAKAELKVEKDFDDWGKADEFTFDLEALGDAPMPKDAKDGKVTVTATEDAKVAAFGEITFEKAGTYEYTITEQNGGADGVSYDTTAHKVTVEVTKAKDATNELKATVTYDKGTDAQIVTNTYASITAKLEATKSFTDWSKASEFEFVLEAIDGAPMPEGAKDGKLTKTATEDAKTAVFGEIEYEQAGTYKYTITEQNGGADGVTYDTTAHEVVVTVTKADDATNALTAEVKYDGASKLIITNTYAGASTLIQATKDFNDWGKADSFTFTLAPVGKAPMALADGTAVEPVFTITEDDSTAVWGPILYEASGTYEYTITETNDGVDGVSYDTKAHKVVVTVTKDPETNELTAVPSYDDEKSLVISNTFTATDAELKVEKDFADWGKATSFTFDLEAVDGAPMPAAAEDGKVTVIATETAKVASFGKIAYDKAGTYKYTITERNDGVDGVSYDITPHTVTVEVTKAEDDTNALSAKVTYDKGEDAQIVSNTFKSVKAKLEATKGLDGRNWADADEFTFDLAAVTKDAPLPEETTQKATKDQQTAVFGEIEFIKTGDYEYTITEQDGGKPGITYDTEPHTVIVHVTKEQDATNALKATVEYKDGEKLEITNEYHAKGQIVLEATKELTGRKLEAGQFTFELKDEAGNVLQTKTNDADGKVTFEALEYTEKDLTDGTATKKYTVSEVKEDKAGYKYAETIYNVTVTLTDNGDGTIKVEADPANGTYAFKNEYHAKGQIVLEATKELTGRKLEAGQFTFELKDEAGNVLQTKTNDANGKVTFDEISYTEEDLENGTGTKKYTVSEVNDSQAGYTYDTKVYDVTVTLTDNGDGTIKVEADPANGTYAFKNVYDASGLIVLNAKKVLKGGTLKAGMFEFTLEGDGIEKQTVKNDKDGNITFAPIAYTLKDLGGAESKVFEYTIKEVKGTDSKIVYDTSEYKATVTVTDDGAGHLLTTVKYTKAGQEVKVPEFVNEGKETETTPQTETHTTPGGGGGGHPKTGDDTPILPWMLTMGLAAAAIVLLMLEMKRREQQRKD